MPPAGTACAFSSRLRGLELDPVKMALSRPTWLSSRVETHQRVPRRKRAGLTLTVRLQDPDGMQITLFQAVDNSEKGR